MYLHNTFGRGLLDFATPLFTEIENTFDPVFVEEDGDYVFEVEMPGFSKEDVKVHLDQHGHLNLEGQTTKRGKEVKFGQAYEVPEKADLPSADASLKDGVFRLTFKRKNKYKPKEIKIK
jgi:HSP20 family molecular chaperone IbpA